MPEQTQPPVGGDGRSPQNILYFGLHPYIVVADDKPHIPNPNHIFTVDISIRKGPLTTMIGTVGLHFADPKPSVKSVGQHLRPKRQRVKLSFPFRTHVEYDISESFKRVKCFSRVGDPVN